MSGGQEDRLEVLVGGQALGAELAITYLNDKARRFVEPLAEDWVCARSPSLR